MYCPFCGYELPDYAKFCQNCGKRLPKYDQTYVEQVAEPEVTNKDEATTNIIHDEQQNQHLILPPFESKCLDEQLASSADVEIQSSNNQDIIEKKKEGAVGKAILTTVFIIILLFVSMFCIGLLADSNTGDSIPSQSDERITDAQYASRISKAIEPTDSLVRSYALSAVDSSNAGSYNIYQICDIYDKLYSDWVYVNDPHGKEYIASASESVRLLRGDCEDYAVLMASLIESIGGTSRIIIAYNADGEGHAYAEVYMSDSKDYVQELIDEMGYRYGYLTAHYHSDADGGYWLNLDWTSRHPGGEFFESVGEELVIWSDGRYVTWN